MAREGNTLGHFYNQSITGALSTSLSSPLYSSQAVISISQTECKILSEIHIFGPAIISLTYNTFFIPPHLHP